MAIDYGAVLLTIRVHPHASLLAQKECTVEASKELAHTAVRLRLILISKETGPFQFQTFDIWWISPPTYYADLLPHWRHN
jgi:hypothetical protein